MSLAELVYRGIAIIIAPQLIFLPCVNITDEVVDPFKEAALKASGVDMGDAVYYLYGQRKGEPTDERGGRQIQDIQIG